MAIYSEIQFSDFWTWLQTSNTYKNAFSYDGARAVFDHMEELSEWETACDNYDPVAWCCSFSEFTGDDEIKSLCESYDVGDLEELADIGTVIHVDDSTIIFGE